MIRRLVLASTIVFGLSLIAAPNASAAPINLNDIYCNCLPAGSTDGGTVDVTQLNATQVQFVVDLNDLLNFHYSNAFDLFAFNYNGANPTLVASGLPSGWQLFTSAQGSASMDGAGHSYEYFINCLTCSATGGISGVNQITFTLTGTGVLATNFLFTNGNNNDFAAAVTRTTIRGCTGVIGGGNGASQSTPIPSSGTAGGSCGATTVPDGGATVGLLGLAMLGLGYLRRRMS